MSYSHTAQPRHRTHTYAMGVNCFREGLDEQQADNVIRQFARVLSPYVWDDFWDGYYTATMKDVLDTYAPMITIGQSIDAHASDASHSGEIWR